MMQYALFLLFLFVVRDSLYAREVILHRKATGDYILNLRSEEECTRYGQYTKWLVRRSICMCQQKSSFFSVNGNFGCYIGNETNTDCKLRFNTSSQSIYTISQMQVLNEFDNTTIASQSCNISTIQLWSTQQWKENKQVFKKFVGNRLSISWTNDEEMKGALLKIPVECIDNGMKTCAYLKIDGESTINLVRATSAAPTTPSTTLNPALSKTTPSNTLNPALSKTTPSNTDNHSKSLNDSNGTLSIALGITSALLLLLIVVVIVLFLYKRRQGLQLNLKTSRQRSSRRSGAGDNDYEDVRVQTDKSEYSYTYTNTKYEGDEELYLDATLQPTKTTNLSVQSSEAPYTFMDRKSGTVPRWMPYPILAPVPDLPSDHVPVTRQSSEPYSVTQEKRDRYSSLNREDLDRSDYVSLKIKKPDDNNLPKLHDSAKPAQLHGIPSHFTTEESTKKETNFQRDDLYDSVADLDIEAEYYIPI